MAEVERVFSLVKQAEPEKAIISGTKLDIFEYFKDEILSFLSRREDSVPHKYMIITLKPDEDNSVKADINLYAEDFESIRRFPNLEMIEAFRFEGFQDMAEQPEEIERLNHTSLVEVIK